MQHVALFLLLQLRVDSLPPPRGFVNDFAAVIPAPTAARLEAVLHDVQVKTGGDIAVVTLPDLGGREAADVALQIGRQWRVGGTGEAGDPRRNLGVVVLVVPLKDHRSGTGEVFISTGRGAEGFLPDAKVGRIRNAMIPALSREDYGGALETGVGLLAQAFAEEFHVTLDTTLAGAPSGQGEGDEAPPVPGVAIGIVALIALLILVNVASRASRFGRRRGIGWWGGWGGWGGGGWGGGGFGGFGGFGGGGSGGFGGFGGGGGFSGGGAGGKF